MLKIYGFTPKTLLAKAVTKMRHKTLYMVMRMITPSIHYNLKPTPRPMTRYLKTKYGDKPLIGVEIGTARGHNARNLFQNLNLTRLYCVDPYTPYVGARGVPHVEYVGTEGRARQVLSKYLGKTKFLKMTSEEAAPFIQEPVDFVYVDGCHSYPVVQKDLQLYYPKVKPGGVFGGHDFTIHYWEVCKAVIEFAERENLMLQGKLQCDWWVNKPW